jgi:succinate dehydrogenase / fumarate reductase cytochrome b subunit
VKDNRPVNLDISTIKFPLAAITSIIHRITGVILLIGFGFLLYLLQLSLESESGFVLVQELLSGLIVKLLTWAVIACLIYHFIAGCKHLLMDLGIGETNEGAQIGSWLVVVFSAVGILIAGVWIW